MNTITTLNLVDIEHEVKSTFAVPNPGRSCTEIFESLRIKLYRVMAHIADRDIKHFIAVTIYTLNKDFSMSASQEALMHTLRIRINNLLDFLRARTKGARHV